MVCYYPVNTLQVYSGVSVQSPQTLDAGSNLNLLKTVLVLISSQDKEVSPSAEPPWQESKTYNICFLKLREHTSYV